MVEEGTTLLIGNDETRSAKKRRQDAYSRDLVLQMQEKSAAKLREKYQGMSVNASGWLDPEKRPERFKPLGGAGYSTDRSRADSKVKRYHTLFDYKKPAWHGEDTDRQTDHQTDRFTGPTVPPPGPPMTVSPRPRVADPVGLHPQSFTEAPSGNNNSIDQAYNFYATKDLNQTASGSIVQPLAVPYVDNRPIILPSHYDQSSNNYQPKFNPFLHSEEPVSKELKAILNISQVETARQKFQIVKDTEEQQRKWRRELDDERRRLLSREANMKREMNDLRRNLENDRRELERQRAQLGKTKTDTGTVIVTHSPPLTVRPSSASLLSEMEETRKRLLAERLAIEKLLLEQQKPKPKPAKRAPRRPATPPDTDQANQAVIDEFAALKNRDAPTRQMFRSVYPDLPQTNVRLEEQQEALIRQQEQGLGKSDGTGTVNKVLTFVRPEWMNKAPTPFPHRLRERDNLYGDHRTYDTDLEGRYQRAEGRERALSDLDGWGVAMDPDKVIEKFENLKLRNNRPASTETLCDDTWLKAASVPVV